MKKLWKNSLVLCLILSLCSFVFPVAAQDTAEESTLASSSYRSPVGIWEAVNLREVEIADWMTTMGFSREKAEQMVDGQVGLYSRIEFCDDGTVRIERGTDDITGIGDGTWNVVDGQIYAVEENFDQQRNLDGGIGIVATDEFTGVRLLPVYMFAWDGDRLSMTELNNFRMDDNGLLVESIPATLFERIDKAPAEEKVMQAPTEFRSPVGVWEAVNLQELMPLIYGLAYESQEQTEQIVDATDDLFIRFTFFEDGTLNAEGSLTSIVSGETGEWIVTEINGETGIMMLAGNEPMGFLVWDGDRLALSGLGINMLFERTGDVPE